MVKIKLFRKTNRRWEQYDNFSLGEFLDLLSEPGNDRAEENLWKPRITTKHQCVYRLLQVELLIAMYTQVNNCFVVRFWIWISSNLSADQKAPKESAGQKPLQRPGPGWSDGSVSLPRQCWKACLSPRSSAAKTLTREAHPAPHPATDRKNKIAQEVWHRNIPKIFPAFLKSSFTIQYSVHGLFSIHHSLTHST